MRLSNYCSVLILALLFVGCSQKTPDEYIAEAETAIFEKDPDKAIIVLKNALASDPKNLKARFILGRTYHEVGEINSAEKELKIAFKGGYFKNQVIPIYLSTLNYLQNDEEIIELVNRLTGLSTDAEAASNMYKGLALFRQNEISRAKLAIKRANEVSSDSPYSMYGRANYAIYEKEPQDAIIILEELLVKDPEFLEAVFLRGKLSVLVKDYETAIESFRQYVDKRPRDIQGNISLANALVKNEDYEEGEKRVTELLSKLKNNPYLNQLKGIIEFKKENYEKAKLAMEAAINSGLNEPSARLVAGLSAYKLNKMEQAHNHLLAVRDILPSSHPARRLLAEIQLSLGYTTGALETVQGLTDLNLNDIRLFTQTSHELIEAKEYEKASQLLTIATQLNPNKSDELLRIALLKLSLKDESAIKDLENIVANSPNYSAAIISLCQVYVEKQRFDDAIKVAKSWVDTKPDNLTALNLLGQVYVKANKVELARDAFNKALNVAENNPASLEFFAQQAANEGNEQESLNIRKQIAETNPNYLQGLFEYFAYAQSQGDSKHALGLIEDSYRNNKGDIQQTLNYARALVLMRDPQKVIDLLNTIEYQKGLPLFFWKAKSDSYFQLDDMPNALLVYKDWQKVEPRNLYAWLGAIAVNDINSDYASALDAVNNAKVLFPDEPQVALLEVHYNLLNKNLLIAKRLYEKLNDELKELPFAKGLKGQFFYAEGNFKQAIPLLQEYYNDTENGRIALTIANANRNAGDLSGSLQTLEKHLNKKPNDLINRMHLAERYMEVDRKKSIHHYQLALIRQQNNLIALNNIAFLLAEEGNIEDALKMSNQAVAIEPENATVNNTHGNILLKNNQTVEAIKYLKRAFDAFPSNSNYREDYEKANK